MEILKIIKHRFQLLVAGSWIHLVQELRNKIAGQNGIIQELELKIRKLEAPRPLSHDVNTMLRAGLNRKLEQDGLLKHLDQVKDLRGRIDILSKNLKQELAYIAYLEDMIRPHYKVDFNGLPLEKREEYFKRVDAHVKGGKDSGRFTNPYDH
jgi:hypothetical protein